MATLCTHCGTALKDAARYCSNCGIPVPSHPLGCQSLSSSHADGQDDNSRVVKPELITQHSPSHPVRYFMPADPPVWLSQLDNQLYDQSKAPPDKLREADAVEDAPTRSLVSSSESKLTDRLHRKSRKSLVLVFLTLLLVVGTVGAWVVVLQPFSVPGITQPWQSFKDARLAFSLLYPNGWKFQVDQRNVSAHFYDSSSTAQVNIVVRSSHGEDLGQYLQQEASRLSMTGQKTAPPLSFAGTSWQQMQGSVLESGASYTEAVVVTVHNQHLFTMLLLAPQGTYAQEDQLVFSGMRSSFQFVS